MIFILTSLFVTTSQHSLCGNFNDVNCCFIKAGEKIVATCDRPTRIWVEYVDKLGRVNLGGVILDYRNHD